MRVVDLGTTTDDHLTWVAPAQARLMYPDVLVHHEAMPWRKGVPYLTDTYVEEGGMIWQAVENHDERDHAPSVMCGGQFGDLKPTDPFPDPFNKAFKKDAMCGWVPHPEMIAANLRTELALTQATWLLNMLTGGRLHGAECWVEDYRLRSCEVKLRRGPVADITRIELIRRYGRDVDPLEWSDWCLVRAGVISFCCNCRSFNDSCGGCGGTIARIYYSTNPNMPPGTQSIVAWLAAELAKASQGKACALPDRISNVTRQGVSWSILDPQDFLDKGHTGIGRIDQWIEAAQMQTGRATLIDPLHSDRAFTQLVPCGAGQFGDQDVTDPTQDPFTHAFRIDT